MTGPDAGPERREESVLGSRFARVLASQGRVRENDGLVVAVSGGMDSLSLLHLLRFTPRLPSLRIVAAHFDHRMRPESAEEALWVRGLCAAWDVPVRLGRARTPLVSEAGARDARYEFLFEVRREEGARWLLTAHHGDDQAETILFRILRGTGLKGLAGIPATRGPGLYRPLLSFTREEIHSHARSVGLRPRHDPSNLDLRYPRNFLRHRTLPDLEEGPAPRARKALRRLGGLARQNEEAWKSLLPSLLQGVLEEDEGRKIVVRSRVLAYHPAVQARLWREILRGSGTDLDEAGTRALLEFTRTGASGRGFPLPGGIRLFREFDRFRVGEEGSPEGHRPLVLDSLEPGSEEVVISGTRYVARWGDRPAGDWGETVEIPSSPGTLEFPLRVRGWVAGDRIRLPYGTKKLKKLFLEARVPAEERGRIPVLVDARGRVLWVAGLATSMLIQVPKGPGTIFFGIRNVE